MGANPTWRAGAHPAGPRNLAATLMSKGNYPSSSCLPAPATTPVDRTELAARLRLAITRTARRMRQRSSGDLSPSMGAALASIERHGPLTPAELADHERFQRPTATRVVAKLEARGLVARTPHPADRRSCLVAVSADGQAMLQDTRRRRTTYLAGRLAAVSDADIATLDRAAEILEQLLDEDDA